MHEKLSDNSIEEQRLLHKPAQESLNHQEKLLDSLSQHLSELFELVSSEKSSEMIHYSALRELVDTAKKSNQELKNLFCETFQKNIQLTQENNELKHQNQSLSKDIIELKQKNEEISVEIRILQQILEKSASQKEVETLHRRIEELEKKLLFDEKTGLPLKAYIEQRLKEYFKALGSTRGEIHYPATILYMDTDGLKRINDNFSESRGDEFIQETAELLKENMRPTDVLARSKSTGDEFLAFLPGIEHNTAQVRLEKIESEIKKHFAPPHILSGMNAGISIGFATIDPDKLAPITLEDSDTDDDIIRRYIDYYLLKAEQGMKDKKIERKAR